MALPIIERLPPDDLLFIPPDTAGQQTSLNRTPGLHLSAIVNDLYYRVIKGESGEFDEEKRWMAFMGFVWEEVIENLIRRPDKPGANWFKLFELGFKSAMGRKMKYEYGVERPAERCYQGIYMHPDGYRPVIGAEPALISEYKATTKSARKLSTPQMFEEEFTTWLWQVAGYCKGWGCNTAVFTGMFVLGDYGKSEWGAGVWRITKQFEEDELEKIWDMLVKHGEVMKKEGRVK